MSSVGQAVGGVVGGVIGFFVGGPAGVMYGAQVGMMVGGLIDPAKVQGPRLEDLTSQTSTYGAFIPRIYGTAPIVGNIFWIQGDKLIEKKAESSGKGGPEVTNFEYFSSFAVSLCEGPIDGVRRIWVGGQLWYDAGSDDLSTIIAGNSNAGKFTLYTGTDTQEADPLIQADRGAANVPAYRGLAYIVFNELPLKGFGNSLAGAQVKVEVLSTMVETPLILESFSLYDSAWHTTIKSVGNQFDEVGGFRNFVTYENSAPYPITWHRVLNQQIVSSSVLAEGSTFACEAVCNSLHRMQYAWMRSKTRAVWGRNGFVYYYNLGASQNVQVIADGGGNAYILSYGGADGTRVTRVDESPPGAVAGDPFLAERIGYAAHTLSYLSMLCAWNGKAVVFFRDGTNPLSVQVFDTDDEGVFSMVDDYTIDLDEPSCSVDSDNSVANVEGDILTFARIYGTGAGRVVAVDLATKTVHKKWYIDLSTYTFTSPVRGGCSVNGNIVYWGERTGAGIGITMQTMYSGTVTGSTAILSDIVQAECLKSDLLTAADIDVTDLTDSVRGYRISSLGPIRGGIDQLRRAWPFDAVQHGYKIKFKTRGGASVATITEAELGAREAGTEPGVQVTNVREMDTVIPDQLTVKYLDAAREYDVNVAEETR